MKRLLFLGVMVGTAGCQPSLQNETGFPYERTHEIDLTGDGRLNLLTLSAHGPTPEDLVVAFSINSGDSTLFFESWAGSGYFAYDLPSDNSTEADRFLRVRIQLDSFFGADAFSRLDPEDPRFAPEAFGEAAALISSALVQPRILDSVLAGGSDSATARTAAWDATWGSGFIHPEAVGIWESMVRSRPPTFRFFSGGEYNRQIAWSHDARRFFSVWECC